MFKKLVFTFLGLGLISCAIVAQPKPSGELRLEHPQAIHQKYSSPCGFTFEHSTLAKIENTKDLLHLIDTFEWKKQTTFENVAI